MVNVFGDSSSSESEDLPPAKLRRIADLISEQPAERSITAQETTEDSDPISYDELEFEEKEEADRVRNDEKPIQASLSRSIMNSDSVAFKMMQKMGYKMGQALGTDDNKHAIREPIATKQLKKRAGLGANTAGEAPDLEAAVSDQSISLFREAEREKHKERLNRRVIVKLKDFCFRLSGDEELMLSGGLVLDDVNVLWRDRAREIYSRIMLDQKPDPSVSPAETRSTDSELALLIGYCRLEYAYCPYCEVQYEDVNDMKKHCPGEAPEDHY